MLPRFCRKSESSILTDADFEYWGEIIGRGFGGDAPESADAVQE